jgi:hypothetical protein
VKDVYVRDRLVKVDNVHVVVQVSLQQRRWEYRMMNQMNPEQLFNKMKSMHQVRLKWVHQMRMVSLCFNRLRPLRFKPHPLYLLPLELWVSVLLKCDSKIGDRRCRD